MEKELNIIIIAVIFVIGGLLYLYYPAPIEYSPVETTPTTTPLTQPGL